MRSKTNEGLYKHDKDDGEAKLCEANPRSAPPSLRCDGLTVVIPVDRLLV